MGQSYIVSNRRAHTAAGTLVQITAAADAVCRIDKIEVSQETQTSSEALGLIVLANPTTGVGAGTVTVTPVETGFAASGVTAIACATTAAAGGTTIFQEGWNVLAPFIWHPTPDERIFISASDLWAINLVGNPGASMTISVNVSITEFGG